MSLGFFPGSTIACSCIEEPLEQSIRESSHIYLIRVTKVEDLRRGEDNQFSGCLRDFEPEKYGVQIKFELLTNYKGNIAQYDFLRSGYGFGDCGFPVYVGMHYLVFSNDNFVSSCSHSMEAYSPDDEEFLDIVQLIEALSSQNEDEGD